ncbi:MAG: hypothetical protein AAF483_20670, partial [Planctomycetota bacterium]
FSLLMVSISVIAVGGKFSLGRNARLKLRPIRHLIAIRSIANRNIPFTRLPSLRCQDHNRGYEENGTRILTS